FREESMDERVGATDEERQVPTRSDVGNGQTRRRTELRRRHVGVDGVDVAEMEVGDPFPLVEGDFVGGYVEAVVELHFVGVYDLRVRETGGGQVDGETTLPGAGGTHDDDEFDLVFIGVAVVGWRGFHASPPRTAVQGEKRMKELRMKRVERRENRFHEDEQEDCRLVMIFLLYIYKHKIRETETETESSVFRHSGFHRIHPLSLSSITGSSVDKNINFLQSNRKQTN
ncbi:hypothetical protein V6N12_018655, partial [Hibiscus sabdariffa]